MSTVRDYLFFIIAVLLCFILLFTGITYGMFSDYAHADPAVESTAVVYVDLLNYVNGYTIVSFYNDSIPPLAESITMIFIGGYSDAFFAIVENPNIVTGSSHYGFQLNMFDSGNLFFVPTSNGIQSLNQDLFKYYRLDSYGENLTSTSFSEVTYITSMPLNTGDFNEFLRDCSIESAYLTFYFGGDKTEYFFRYTFNFYSPSYGSFNFIIEFYIWGVHYDTSYDVFYNFPSNYAPFPGLSYPYHQDIDISTSDNGSYLQGWDDGVAHANSIVTESSASYTAGYTAGISSQEYSFLGLISAVIDVPVKVFVSLFNFDILGFNMLAFVGSLLAICTVIAILRKVL